MDARLKHSHDDQWIKSTRNRANPSPSYAAIIHLPRLMMSRFQVIPFDVDAAGRETWTAFHAFRRANAAELHPDDPVWDDAECEHDLRKAHPLSESLRWLALDGGDLVGSAGVGFRRAGTPNADEFAPFLHGWGSVAAPARRRGIGTLLLRQVHALMHDLGKSVLTLSAHTDGGHAFMTHIGATAKYSAVESRARLDALDWPLLRTWEDGAGELGLSWECHAGRVPREVLLAFLPTFTDLIADIPLGSLEMPPIRLEIEYYDSWYESMARTEEAHHLVMLREPGGAVVAMSEASWDSRSPKTAFQMFTAIAPPWRGRGLARAVKAAILRQIRGSHPCTEDIRTFNAESNAAILSINKRLGFTVRERSVDYQVTRAELDARLPAADGV
jgi:GNAT superfamily N-acetyltransferase